MRLWALLTLVCLSVLGQGERTRIDPRFRSPGATLTTYWRALEANDVEVVRECFAQPGAAVPFPGMLCFLPPCRSLMLYAVHYTDVRRGQLVATYEVRFEPDGGDEEMHVVTSNELVKIGAAWRIVRAADDVGMPDWRPIPRRVDI